MLYGHLQSNILAFTVLHCAGLNCNPLLSILTLASLHSFILAFLSFSNHSCTLSFSSHFLLPHVILACCHSQVILSCCLMSSCPAFSCVTVCIDCYTYASANCFGAPFLSEHSNISSSILCCTCQSIPKGAKGLPRRTRLESSMEAYLNMVGVGVQILRTQKSTID